MKSRGQFLIIILFLVVFSSCKDEEKQPVARTEVTKDSNRVINSQQLVNPYASIDNSPMDMSYYPVDFPKLKMANNNTPAPVARVIYSRPRLQGRPLFSKDEPGVLKYGEPWRLGANESTEIQFYMDVMVQDKKIRPGRYTLYCIPQPDKWIVVLNSNIDSWGLKQDSTKDIQKFDVPVSVNSGGPSLEYFTIVFEKTTSGADMVMAWYNVAARLPLTFKQ